MSNPNDYAALIERLHKLAAERDALAEEWASKDIGDKFDLEAARAYREEANELRLVASALTTLLQERDSARQEAMLEAIDAVSDLRGAEQRLRYSRDRGVKETANLRARAWDEAMAQIRSRQSSTGEDRE